MAKINLQHPLMQMAAPLIGLALLYRAGAVGIEYIGAIQIRNVPVVSQQKVLSPLSLPSVYVAAQKKAESNPNPDLEAAFQSAESLIPKPMPVLMAEAPPVRPPPSPLEMLTNGVAFSAIGSEGVFVKGIFYPWGGKYQEATIVGKEGNGIIFQLSKERRIVPIAQSPAAPSMQSLPIRQGGI